jgi:hypothetical protein
MAAMRHIQAAARFVRHDTWTSLGKLGFEDGADKPVETTSDLAAGEYLFFFFWLLRLSN